MKLKTKRLNSTRFRPATKLRGFSKDVSKKTLKKEYKHRNSLKFSIQKLTTIPPFLQWETQPLKTALNISLTQT